MKNKNILIYILAFSILVNFYFVLSKPNLYVGLDNDWTTNQISIKGYLQPLNYEPPKNWDTLFFIDIFTNKWTNSKPLFYAKEVVFTNGILVDISLKEYEIVKINEDKIIAKDDIYTFEITRGGIVITDKDGDKSKLSDGFIDIPNKFLFF